jgi:hypothetical protein
MNLLEYSVNIHQVCFSLPLLLSLSAFPLSLSPFCKAAFEEEDAPFPAAFLAPAALFLAAMISLSSLQSALLQ